jgi:hypothetical protein
MLDPPVDRMRRSSHRDDDDLGGPFGAVPAAARALQCLLRGPRRREAGFRFLELCVQPAKSGDRTVPPTRELGTLHDHRSRQHAVLRRLAREAQTRGQQHHERDHHDQGGAEREPQNSTDHPVHAAQRAFADRFREVPADPVDERRDGKTRQRRNDPAQQEVDDGRPGVAPVLADPRRDPRAGPDAEEDAKERENLRDGAAQDSANREREQQDQKDPVQPRNAVQEVQRC